MKSKVHLDDLETALAWAAIISLRASEALIDSNASYVLRKLPELSAMPAGLRSDIASVWEELASCCYDVRTEIRNLEDKLGLHGDAEWNDPGICNDDPLVTIGFITGWLQEEASQIDALVRKLETQRELPHGGLAYILVTESAVNVLHSLGDVHDAAERIRAIVRATS